MDDKILEAFNFGTIQDCKNLKLKLDEHGITWDEFLSWVDDKAMFNRLDNIPMIKPCPDCEKPLRLFPVNTEPWNMIDESLKSQWICICGYETFSEKTVMEELALAREAKEKAGMLSEEPLIKVEAL